jgi:hypothetical protein
MLLLPIFFCAPQALAVKLPPHDARILLLLLLHTSAYYYYYFFFFLIIIIIILVFVVIVLLLYTILKHTHSIFLPNPPQLLRKKTVSQKPAVHGEDLSADVAGRVQAEEGHGPRHFFRFAYRA